MEEELTLNNILGEEEAEELFQEDIKEETKDEDPINTEEITEVIDAEKLFEKPESVGNDEEIKEEITEKKDKKDTVPIKDSSSPKDNFYSSIAKALKEDGIFPDLDSDITDNIKEPEDFAEAVEKQIQLKLSEKQRRIDQALTVGVEPDDIKRFENTINYLDEIDDKTLTDESDKGETLRKQLIYQDFINRGYSKERAQREIDKSINGGTDIEDAKEALKSTKDFFEEEYNKVVQKAKQLEEETKNSIKEQATTLKKSILEDKSIFGDLEVDKSTRQKIYDNISKPVYQDSDSGEYYTAIQKYEMEHRVDFMKNLGLIFTLTDGFKNIDGLVKGKVKKEVKKGLRELENTINNTSRTTEGNLRFASGVDGDSESFMTIDI